MPSHPPQFDSNAESDTDRLTARVGQLRNAGCAVCGRTLCGHQAVFAVALGCQDRPLCIVCLAIELGRPWPALRDQLYDHVSHRDCYATVWEAESQIEGVAARAPPPCLWPPAAERESAATVDRAIRWDLAGTAAANSEPDASDSAAAVAYWDAGDLGCGELVLELRLRLRALDPGRILELVAHDPGAPADLPAWCALTGHRLVRREPPRYWIQRKEN